MGIAAIETGIIERIRATLANRVRTVESLPGNWDDDTMKRLLRTVPGVYVAWPGADNRQGLWVVYVATGHASGQAARRLGDSQQVGAYELIEALAPALNDYTIKGEGTLSLTKVENLYSGTVDKQGLTLYAMHLSLPMVWPTVADESLLTPFETFATQLDTPPLSNDAEHRKWLAGDYTTSSPQAKDTVVLPQ